MGQNSSFNPIFSLFWWKKTRNFLFSFSPCFFFRRKKNWKIEAWNAGLKNTLIFSRWRWIRWKGGGCFHQGGGILLGVHLIKNVRISLRFMSFWYYNDWKTDMFIVPYRTVQLINDYCTVTVFSKFLKIKLKNYCNCIQ